ncbi:MAG: 4Fe-4S binding protein [Chloroflexi bacterium]|nr:4Fe-4S binding protein [Chloroflexota bacterium]
MLDLGALKQGGFIKQPQDDVFTVRIRMPGGRVTVDQLARVQEAARKYGQGYVHLTTRQGFELPWVHYGDFEALRVDLAEVDLYPAGCGPRVRNVMACPGTETCGRGLVDTYTLAKQLSERYVGREVQVKKLKMAIAGCPNSCSTPQVNDLGFVATVEPQLDGEFCNGCGLCVDACREKAISIENDLAVIDRTRCVNCGDCVNTCPFGACKVSRSGFSVFLGGKVGRHPRLGQKVGEFVPAEALPRWVDGVLAFAEARGNRAERFGALLDRVGIETMREYLPEEAVV